MRNYLLILVLALCVSCSDSEIETVNMRINHYKATATGMVEQFVYLVQEDEAIGTDQWSYFYNHIIGFEFEAGYIYSLKIRKEDVENPPADGFSTRYTLEEIISKEKVPDDITFPINLKNEGLESKYVTGDIETGFKILGSVSIQCNELCNKLSQRLQSYSGITGIFQRSGSSTYTLLQFKMSTNTIVLKCYFKSSKHRLL